MQKIHVQWRDLCHQIGMGKNIDEVFDKLVTAYAEPHRVYHVLKHIEQCLQEFDQYVQVCAPVMTWDQKSATEMTFWFHDVIYDPKAQDNEAQSAIYFRNEMEQFVLSGFLNKVMSSINITRHDVAPFTDEEKLIVDIDLSILGQPTEVFDRYDRDIRAEYIWVPEDDYREGRAQVLQSFMNRDAIYATTYFYEKYEAQARINLTRAIEKLRS